MDKSYRADRLNKQLHALSVCKRLTKFKEAFGARNIASKSKFTILLLLASIRYRPHCAADLDHRYSGHADSHCSPLEELHNVKRKKRMKKMSAFLINIVNENITTTHGANKLVEQMTG